MEKTVKKHKDAIKKLRQIIKDQSGHTVEFRNQIRALRVTETGERRPETGPQRSQMKNGYDDNGRRWARANYLALGLLRGRPYSSMERKSAEPLYMVSHKVWSVITTLLEGSPELKAEWTPARVNDLLEGKPDPVAVEAA